MTKTIKSKLPDTTNSYENYGALLRRRRIP